MEITKNNLLIAFLFFYFSSINPALAGIALEVSPGETLRFLNFTDCNGTPQEGNARKVSHNRCFPDDNVLEAAAYLNISAVNLDVSATSTGFLEFDLTSSGDETVLKSTVSGVIEWDGLLFGAGVLGAGAEAQIEVILYDETDRLVKGSKVIMKEDQESIGLKGIDVGGSPVRGQSEFSFEGTVIRGHRYSILMELTCTAKTGLIGVAIGCVFAPDVPGLDRLGDHRAFFRSISITIEGDIFERIDVIERKIDLHDMEVQEKMDILDMKIDEVIRLLETPTGLNLNVPACHGKKCNSPDIKEP